MVQRTPHNVSKQRDDYAAKYGELALFRDVDTDAFGHLFAICEEVEVEAGDIVLEQGAPNDSIFVVLSGGLTVRLGTSSPEPLLHLGEGACAGELSILSRVNVSAHVIAAQRSRLLVIREDEVWSFIGSSHEFARNLLRILSGRVRDDNTRLQQSMHAQAHYARTSRMDALTGLFNRRWLDEVLDRQCRRCAEDATTMSLILVDIDHFKQVNDRFGHLFGDEALKAVANHLCSGTRPLDIAARFGGEEFAVLLHGVDLRGAVEIAERIRNDIAEADILGPEAAMKLTVSMGVAQLQEFEQPVALLETADRALYEAKHLGRNRVVTATEFDDTGLV